MNEFYGLQRATKAMMRRGVVQGNFILRNRFFASVVGTAADLPASEHVPPGASFVTALQAFCQHKLRGDRLGYAWRVDEKAQMEIPLFHFEQV